MYSCGAATRQQHSKTLQLFKHKPGLFLIYIYKPLFQIIYKNTQKSTKNRKGTSKI